MILKPGSTYKIKKYRWNVRSCIDETYRYYLTNGDYFLFLSEELIEFTNNDLHFVEYRYTILLNNQKHFLSVNLNKERDDNILDANDNIFELVC